MDTQLKRLWADELDVEEQYLEDDDNFFEIGGSSISAVRLVAAAEKAGLSLTVTDIYRNPELSQMASVVKLDFRRPADQTYSPFDLLDSVNKDGVLSQINNILPTTDRESIEDVYPCTPLQEGLMAASIKQRGSYVSQFVYQLDAGIDIGRLQAAWDKVVAASDILRARLIQLDDMVGTFHVILKQPLQWYQAKNLDVYLGSDKTLPMGLGDPLMRLAIVSDGTTQHLVWTIHHAIYDRWSVGSVLNQVSSIYQGTMEDVVSPPRFSGFIKHLLDADIAEWQKFWANRLADIQTRHFPELPSPNYQPRTSARFRYSAKIARRDQSDLTISSVIQAAWGMTIAKHSDADDVVFGMTLIGRDSPVAGVTQMLGPTVATVPVRIRLDDGRDVGAFLRDVQEQGTDLIPYEHLGLQRISKLSQQAWKACQFQSLLVIQPYMADSSPSGWTKVDLGDNDSHPYGIVVECTLGEDQTTLSVSVAFDPKVISETGVQSVIHHFEQAILQLNSSVEDRNLAQIDLFSPYDSSKLFEWNANRVPGRADETVHDVFQRAVQQTPEAPAVSSWDGDLTYRQLDGLSSQLAQYLTQSYDVGPGRFVPLCFDKCKWVPVVMLAVLKTSSAFVPLEASHPPSRLNQLVQDVHAKVILCSPANCAIFNHSAINVLAIDKGTFDRLEAPGDAQSRNGDPNTAAYVLYTSGSTGKPKGVVIEQQAFVASCAAHGKALNVNSSSRVLQFASYSFDASVGEILTTLLHGGCVCIPSNHEKFNELPAAMTRMQVNWAFMTPSYSRVLEPPSLPHLETLVLGGEALAKDDLARWTCHGVRTIEAYGPTECSVYCAANSDIDSHSDPRNIGRTFGCVSWIVDKNDHHKLAPVGCPGELVIDGPILARGYLNNPSSTAAAFIENPAWSSAAGGRPLTSSHRFYKTGDLVQYNQDGTMTFLGRKDGQVKFHGQRLEIAEIEHHIKAHLGDNVHVAVELAINDSYDDGDNIESRSPQHQLLVAFICDSDAETFLTTTSPENIMSAMADGLRDKLLGLKGHLTQALPPYMVPGAYIPLQKIPMMASSKLDRSYLRKMVSTLPRSQLNRFSLAENQKKRAPSTDMERKLHELWVKGLKLNPNAIGVDDNFFHLGGDSVMAIRLAAVARGAEVEITVLDVFNHPTISQLASRSKDLDRVDTHEVQPLEMLGDCSHKITSEVASQLSVTMNDISDIYPCTPLQEGLMAVSIRQPGTYVTRHAFRLSHMVDLERLQSAWDAAIARLDILRTRVVNTELGLMQVVMEAERPKWEVVTDSLMSFLERSQNQDMGCGLPLAHYAIVKDEGEDYLVWTAHHVLYDGWSMPLVLETVESIYSDRDLAKSPRFASFVKYLGSINTTASNEFWTNHLSENNAIAFPSLPDDNYKPQTNESLTRSVSLPKPTHPSSTTLSTCIQAAWALVAGQQSGTEDVVFGMVLSGRDSSFPGVQTIRGPTLTTVPARIRLDQGNVTIADFLGATQEMSKKMIPYQHMGLQRIAKLSADAKQACDIQTLLVVQPSSGDNEGSGIFSERIKSDKGLLHGHALVIECALADRDRMDIKFAFDNNVISAGMMGHLLGQFDWALAQIAIASGSQDTRLDAISLIPPQELELIRGWSVKSLVPPEDACVPEFIEHLSAQSEKEAICAWDGIFTYRELDELSNRLAHALVGLGIKPETLVPICFEKSGWTIVAMLGILKAGGAFVPLDPSHPVERLRALVDQTREASAGVLIGSSSSLLSNVSPESTVLELSSSTHNWLPNDVSPIYSDVQPSNAAYVLFTSGSTGAPKGVVVEHRALCTTTKPHGKELGLNESSRVLQFASLVFDISILEIIVTLAHGGCVCVPSEETRMSNLAEFMNATKVNWAYFTPTFGTLINPWDVPFLQTLRFGGEKASRSFFNTWEGHVRLIQGYGPTECTISCTANPLTSSRQPANIGHGFVASFWVVHPSDHNRLLPVGAVGELMIGGPCLAREYLNDSDKTNAAFIKSPSWTESVGNADNFPTRFYKTGDLVRFIHDGTIEFVGRKDAQTKLHGQRLELGEIEHHAKMHMPESTQVAAEVIDREGHNAFLGVFLCLNKEDGVIHDDVVGQLTDGLKAQFAELESALIQTLPSYMVPSAFIPVNYIPRAVSGKLDRRALVRAVSDLQDWTEYSLANVRQQEDPQSQKPRTDKESQLQGLWATVLQRIPGSIGRNDSFFRLGGDSIQAIRLVAVAGKAGLNLTVGDIFRYPHLKDIALVTGVAAGKDVVGVPLPFSQLNRNWRVPDVLSQAAMQCHIDTEAIEDAYPCTSVQERFISGTNDTSRAFTLQQVYELPDETDIGRLRDTWGKTVATTEVLRTRIVRIDGSLIQVVLKEGVSWKHTDSLDEYVEQDERDHMSLGTALNRVAIIGRNFVWTTHHSVYDGWSINLVRRRVNEIYHHGDLMSSSKPFSTFVQHIQSQDSRANTAFWEHYLHGATPQKYPPAPSPTHQTKSSASMQHTIRNISPQGPFTLTTMLRAAWAMIVGRQLSSTDIVFGSPISGRNAPCAGISDIIGPTLDIIPNRIKINPNETVTDLLDRVQTQSSEMMPYEQTGYMRTIGAADKDLIRACAVQNMLLVQPFAESTMAKGVLGKRNMLHNPDTQVRCGILLQCWLGDDEIVMDAMYDPVVVTGDHVQQRMQDLGDIMRQWTTGSLSMLVKETQFST